MSICWFPREVGSVCDQCTEGRVLLQYASNSSSPRPCAPSGHWSPREAEGTVQYYILYLIVFRFHFYGCCHCEGGSWLIWQFCRTYSCSSVLSLMLIILRLNIFSFFSLCCLLNFRADCTNKCNTNLILIRNSLLSPFVYSMIP